MLGSQTTQLICTHDWRANAGMEGAEIQRDGAGARRCGRVLPCPSLLPDLEARRDAPKPAGRPMPAV